MALVFLSLLHVIFVYIHILNLILLCYVVLLFHVSLSLDIVLCWCCLDGALFIHGMHTLLNWFSTRCTPLSSVVTSHWIWFLSIQAHELTASKLWWQPVIYFLQAVVAINTWFLKLFMTTMLIFKTYKTIGISDWQVAYLFGK